MNVKVSMVVLVVLAGVAAGEGLAQVYCGRRLAQTLGALCSTNYLVKRAGFELYGLSGPGALGATEMRGGAGAWGATELRGARGKRQVVSECCMKACTIDELLTYC